MNFKKIIYLAWLNIKSSKFKSIIFTIIYVIIITLILLFYSGINSIFNFIDRMYDSNFNFKMIAVELDDKKREDVVNELEKLKLKNVEKIFASNYDISHALEISNDEVGINNGNVTIYGNYKGINYTIDSGRDIKSKYEMVCPDKYYPKSSSNSKLSDFYDLTKYLNKTFNVKYNSYLIKNNWKQEITNTFQDKLTLVGTYSFQDDLTNYNSCYVSTEYLEEVLNKGSLTFESEDLKTKFYKDLEVYLLVDKRKNVNKVMNILDQNGYHYWQYYDIEDNVKMIENIAKIGRNICVGMFIFLIIINYVFIKNSLYENKKNILFYKVIGYEDKSVKKIFILQYVILLLIAFIISLFMVFGIKIYLANYISNIPDLSVYKINISILESLLFITLTIILITILITFNLKKINNKLFVSTED